MLDKRQFYINGQWVDPSTKNDLDVINPSDETVCAVVSLGSQADTDAAVAAARTVLPQPGGPYNKIPLGQPKGNKSDLLVG